MTVPKGGKNQLANISPSSPPKKTLKHFSGDFPATLTVNHRISAANLTYRRFPTTAGCRYSVKKRRNYRRKGIIEQATTRSTTTSSILPLVQVTGQLTALNFYRFKFARFPQQS